MTASVSPSPGGEGRGEGGRHTIYFAHLTLKTLALCLLLVAVVGCRDANVGLDAGKSGDADGGTNDITIKVTERDRDKDGKPDSRIEQFFRGDQKVMIAFSERSSRSKWIVTSRSYDVGGTTAAMEHDEDGDGVFETLVLYREGSEDLEVFARQTDGSVRPASTQVVAGHKKLTAAFRESLAEMFDKSRTPTNVDEKTIEERFRATQKKVQEALKEIHEGKQ